MFIVSVLYISTVAFPLGLCTGVRITQSVPLISCRVNTNDKINKLQEK